MTATLNGIPSQPPFLSLAVSFRITLQLSELSVITDITRLVVPKVSIFYWRNFFTWLPMAQEVHTRATKGSVESVSTRPTDPPPQPLKAPCLPLRTFVCEELQMIPPPKDHHFTMASGTETLADMVRRTSKFSKETDCPIETSLLVVEMQRSHEAALIQSLYKWIKISLTSLDASDDLASSLMNYSQENVNRFYFSNNSREKQSTRVVIFDELMLLDPLQLITTGNIPQHSVDSVSILQEVDRYDLLASVHTFLEEITTYQSKLKLIVIICSETVALTAFDLIRRLTPPCKVLLVTSCFPKRLLEGNMVSVGMTLDEKEQLKLNCVKASEPVKE